jgi:hypothetical protein
VRDAAYQALLRIVTAPKAGEDRGSS